MGANTGDHEYALNLDLGFRARSVQKTVGIIPKSNRHFAQNISNCLLTRLTIASGRHDRPEPQTQSIVIPKSNGILPPKLLNVDSANKENRNRDHAGACIGCRFDTGPSGLAAFKKSELK
jgi:hypothetical protein